jgi:hypothetical protein
MAKQCGELNNRGKVGYLGTGIEDEFMMKTKCIMEIKYDWNIVEYGE